MNYELTIHQQPTYLHAIVTGVNGLETVQRYLQELRAQCLARGCVRLLVEERLEGPRLGLMDVFKIASQGSIEASGTFEAFAYVDANAHDGDLMKFAETVAVNRRLPVAVFSNVEDAEQWLLNERRP